MNYKITVTGLVQGVGFRPMVAELAEECKLSGQVKNLGGVVEIIVSGNEQAVENFLYRLKCVSGKNADRNEAEVYRVGRIDTLEVEVLEQIDANCCEKFKIVESGNTREQKRFLPIDFPTCDRCKEELFDPNNRRYRYPFISCTQCGPRYSIQKKVPYDRDAITMDAFVMCPECEKEYSEKGNIRRHAQTIACHDCGPQLKLTTFDKKDNCLHTEENDTERFLAETVKAIRKEQIVAIKDIGGFHFAFSPESSKAAKRLREFKARDKKPFAVMFFDIDELKEYCEVSPKEEELLESVARPIVLLKKKKDFVPEICGDSDRIGAMLPCNPLQLLLLKETGPLVMTSGNRGGEPIIIDDKETESLMKQGCPDMMLTHDREILPPLDDSIYQVNGDYVQIIRRARGLVPEPIWIKRELKRDTLAAGGDLKATFALGRDHLAYLSQYFGDLEDVRCEKRRGEALIRMEELLEIKPEITVGDLHPSYVSSKGTEEKIQHHEAHVASVIAEHGLEGKVLGFAFDGTGFGTDGTIWGSEAFVFDEGQMERVGHLVPVKLLGGDAGAKDGDKTLFSYMMEARERGILAEEEFREILRNDSVFKDVAKESRAENDLQEITCKKSDAFPQAINRNEHALQEMAWKQNINTVYSSSMGRLFDAASALLDICHYNSYEGESAILLEQAAHKGRELLLQNQDCTQEVDVIPSMAKVLLETSNFLTFEKMDGKWMLNGVELLVSLWKLKHLWESRELTEENLSTRLLNPTIDENVLMEISNCTLDEQKQILAYLFHYTITNCVIYVAEKICKEQDIHQIALSGGSFINRILLSEVTEGLKEKGLKEKGLKVYTNEKVPCGDGGIALGQMYLYAVRSEKSCV